MLNSVLFGTTTLFGSNELRLLRCICVVKQGGSHKLVCSVNDHAKLGFDFSVDHEGRDTEILWPSKEKIITLLG